jgi:quercetin dioxygenase-like cupin family protein
MKCIRFQDVAALLVTGEGVTRTRIRWLIKKEDGAPNFAMRVLEMEPGGSSPFHDHPWEHEVFVLEGEGTVWAEGRENPLAPGMAVFVPSGEKHRFRNEGKGVFRFICIVPNSAY